MNYPTKECHLCPYFGQQQIAGTAAVVVRDSPPVLSESNGSRILLVFQAPGIDEWKIGKPLQPTRKPGGSAGRRIELSWSRTGFNRSNFDITNAVLCYPGHKKNRDNKPSEKAIACCIKNLEKTILNENYSRVIAFGEIAIKSSEFILQSVKNIKRLVRFRHPCGGCDNESLDALWNGK